MGKRKKSDGVTQRTLHYFWQATKLHRKYAVGGLITTPLVVLLRNVVAPLLLAQMIDVVSLGLPAEQLWQTLLPLAIGLVVAEAVRNLVAGPIRLWCVWKMEIYAMYTLGSQSFEAVAAQSMQFHNDRFSGSLVSQTNKFLGAYERLMDEFFWNIFPVALDVIFIVIVMLPRAPLYVVGMAIFAVIYLSMARWWFRRLGPLHEAEAASSNKLTGQLADSISNISSVKSYAREDHEIKRYNRHQDKWFSSVMRLLTAETKRNYCFDLIGVGITALVAVLMLGAQSWFGLSVATLVLVVNYTQSIMGDLWAMHSTFKTLNRIFGDAREMTEILDLPDDVVDLPGAKPLRTHQAAIDFDNITFRHHDAKAPIFQDFSLQVQPGERIGLVGVSGSGKTTLTKLLLRFADVQQGKITIDGQDIKHVTQKSLREAIAYVPQETALFHRSIAENIAYGRPGASLKEVQRAARLANAEEFIKELPDGYDTLVGERGVKLSGGQRQRVAIARAILKDAPILVLDEATSALDSESEALIQGALGRLMQGRTSIVIAHRLSTVANLDRIVVLEDGKIVEQGRHADLLQAGGVYSKLWSRQSGAFLE